VPGVPAALLRPRRWRRAAIVALLFHFSLAIVSAWYPLSLWSRSTFRVTTEPRPATPLAPGRAREPQSAVTPPSTWPCTRTAKIGGQRRQRKAATDVLRTARRSEGGGPCATTVRQPRSIHRSRRPRGTLSLPCSRSFGVNLPARDTRRPLKASRVPWTTSSTKRGMNGRELRPAAPCSTQGGPCR